MQAAFNGAADRKCRAVRNNQPYEVQSLSPTTMLNAGLDPLSSGGLDLPVPMSRKTLLSVGLTQTPTDRDALPLLSAPYIRSYLGGNYVALQVLIRRNLDTGALRLHDEGVVAHLPFTGSRLTTPFEALVLRSLDDTRCLGFWLPAGATIDEDPLHTLVFITRHPMLDTTAMPPAVRPHYELLFVRAHNGLNAVGDEFLTLHSFATAEGGAKLQYLAPADPPATPSQCTLCGDVTFLSFAPDGLTPNDSALRALRIRSRAEFAELALNEYASTKGAKESWHERVNDVLDAAIDGKLK
jgi:hypothetical protein